MSYKLSKSDYVKILTYYDISVPKSFSALKQSAENIISEKLCSCIKKVSPTNEPKAIGVCTRTVINRKGMKRGKFRCKKKQSVELTKTRKNGISIQSKNKTRKA